MLSSDLCHQCRGFSRESLGKVIHTNCLLVLSISYAISTLNMPYQIVILVYIVAKGPVIKLHYFTIIMTMSRHYTYKLLSTAFKRESSIRSNLKNFSSILSFIVAGSTLTLGRFNFHHTTQNSTFLHSVS